MTEYEKIKCLKKIRFGDIDANSDPDLEHYFIDNNYWNRIINNSIYYIIGKKGTGKSAIYQYLSQESKKKGALISNRDFGDFPFERLMQLSDDSFSKPNQYQSIWEHLILDVFIDLIIRNENADTQNNYFNELKKYYDMYLGDTINLHKDSLTTVSKNGFNLEFSKRGFSPAISKEKTTSKSIGSGIKNVSKINSTLFELIEQYLITRDENNTYIIQFDRLDDTYNQYTNIETYYQMIISLLKVVYSLNNKLRIKRIENAKIIVFLRSDIINEIGKRDSESARWDDFTYKINWAIINQNDWEDAPLLKMINKRIQNTLKDDTTFSDLFETQTINLRYYNVYTGKVSVQQDVFKYIIDKTFHRPRDVIQFCKCIQKEISETPNCTYIGYRNIKNAEKQFTYWLVNSEISNEINPTIKNVDVLYDLLKLIGKKPFPFYRFKQRYEGNPKFDFNMSADKLVEYLYDVGILLNTNRNRNGQLQFRSVIRNSGKVDKNMKLMIHPGVWMGLNS